MSFQKISTVKDTIREFEGYLNTSKSRLDGMMGRLDIGDNNIVDVMNVDDKLGLNDNEEEEEDEDDMEDDETTYLDSEYSIVEQSISLMETTQDALKTGLAVMTVIADMFSRANDSQSQCDAALSSSNLSEETSSPMIDTKVASETQTGGYSCNLWVSEISRLSQLIESAITDFGAELYPPLTEEATDKLRENGRKLFCLLESYVQLLVKKSNFESECEIMTNNIIIKLRVLIDSSLFIKT